MLQGPKLERFVTIPSGANDACVEHVNPEIIKFFCGARLCSLSIAFVPQTTATLRVLAPQTMPINNYMVFISAIATAQPARHIVRAIVIPFYYGKSAELPFG